MARATCAQSSHYAKAIACTAVRAQALAREGRPLYLVSPKAGCVPEPIPRRDPGEASHGVRERERPTNPVRRLNARHGILRRRKEGARGAASGRKPALSALSRLEEHMSDQRQQQRPLTTTDAGSPAPSDDTSLTVGAGGPVLLQDRYLNEKLAHFVRERIPDRVYHVKGGGAFGYFEVTADVTQWTKAAFLNKVGKRTPLFLRFSSVAGEEGYPDSDRDVRGFALKFYTEEGNYDLVGNNTPVFFVRDPMKFPDFIHSQERMPDTGLRNNNMQWDFWTLSPESAHQVTILMSDRGTPRAWRHMNGYSSDTYMWVNARGQRFWVKYHFKTEQGVQNFTDA